MEHMYVTHYWAENDKCGEKTHLGIKVIKNVIDDLVDNLHTYLSFKHFAYYTIIKMYTFFNINRYYLYILVVTIVAACIINQNSIIWWLKYK